MCRGGGKRPIEEVQADRFAEALLMPRSIIISSCKKESGLRGYSRRGRLALAAKAIQSSGVNNVSVSAMEMRLTHLGLLPSFDSKASIMFKNIRKLFSS